MASGPSGWRHQDQKQMEELRPREGSNTNCSCGSTTLHNLISNSCTSILLKSVESEAILHFTPHTGLLVVVLVCVSWRNLPKQTLFTDPCTSHGAFLVLAMKVL